MESMEDPRVTLIWLLVKEDEGANPKADPIRATRQMARKDFMVDELDRLFPVVILCCVR